MFNRKKCKALINNTKLCCSTFNEVTLFTFFFCFIRLMLCHFHRVIYIRWINAISGQSRKFFGANNNESIQNIRRNVNLPNLQQLVGRKRRLKSVHMFSTTVCVEVLFKVKARKQCAVDMKFHIRIHTFCVYMHEYVRIHGCLSCIDVSVECSQNTVGFYCRL